MVKKLSHICVMFSMLITLTHQLVMHHHHHELEVAHYHDDQGSDTDPEHNGHNLFSFGQIDHSYVHKQLLYILDSPFCVYVVTTLFHIESEDARRAYLVPSDHTLSDSPLLKRYLLRGPPVS